MYSISMHCAASNIPDYVGWKKIETRETGRRGFMGDIAARVNIYYICVIICSRYDMCCTFPRSGLSRCLAASRSPGGSVTSRSGERWYNSIWADLGSLELPSPGRRAFCKRPAHWAGRTLLLLLREPVASTQGTSGASQTPGCSAAGAGAST